ncbi:hypothetical protein FNV43_RR15312 [Rhamnella rubrinervis]|uniref:Reverse transcriptase zinc-binding domain-containing protein n=1 Tax=Rhamnella rubrinervis TaxID=2594499 RepID=A0A8K0E6B2_9ROSA|nr:hypothetical protein FNV43_RR15312 [Rhamnella rubrinervis]
MGHQSRNRLLFQLFSSGFLSLPLRVGFKLTSESRCNPVKKSGPVSMDHVLLALRETKEDRDLRIRSLFNFFDAANGLFPDRGRLICPPDSGGVQVCEGFVEEVGADKAVILLTLITGCWSFGWIAIQNPDRLKTIYFRIPKDDYTLHFVKKSFRDYIMTRLKFVKEGKCSVLEPKNRGNSEDRNKLHERLKLHLWRMLANVIPTKEVLANRLMLRETSCICCAAEAETRFYVFKECPLINSLAFASSWSCRWEIWECSSVRELVEACLSPERNMDFFRGKNNFWELVRNFNRSVKEFFNCNHSTVKTLPTSLARGLIKKKWELPPIGWLKINVDAARKDGNFAWAMLVRNEKGNLLFLTSKLSRSDSSTEVELEALGWAIEYAARPG